MPGMAMKASLLVISSTRHSNSTDFLAVSTGHTKQKLPANGPTISAGPADDAITSAKNERAMTAPI